MCSHVDSNTQGQCFSVLNCTQWEPLKSHQGIWPTIKILIYLVWKDGSDLKIFPSDLILARVETIYANVQYITVTQMNTLFYSINLSIIENNKLYVIECFISIYVLSQWKLVECLCQQVSLFQLISEFSYSFFPPFTLLTVLGHFYY